MLACEAPWIDSAWNGTPEAPQRLAAWKRPSEPGTAAVSKPGVLVVDDEEAVRDLLAVVLAAQGFTVYLAADGGEALDLYRQHRRTCLRQTVSAG